MDVRVGWGPDVNETALQDSILVKLKAAIRVPGITAVVLITRVAILKATNIHGESNNLYRSFVRYV